MKKTIFIIAVYSLAWIHAGYPKDSHKPLVGVEPRMISTSPGATHSLTVTNKSQGLKHLKLDVSGIPKGFKIEPHGTLWENTVISKDQPTLAIKVTLNQDIAPGSYRFFITAKNQSGNPKNAVIGVPIQLYVFNGNQTVVPARVIDKSIRGIVYDDRNQNDQIDPAEPISDAIVKVAGTRLKSTTDISGYFYMVRDPKRDEEINDLQFEVTLTQ